MKKFKNVFLAFFVTALTSLNLALPAYAEEATTQTIDSAGFSVSVVGDGTVTLSSGDFTKSLSNGDIYNADYEEGTEIKRSAEAYTYMGTLGESYSIMNRFLPPSYRMFQPSTTLYDSMIYVSNASPTKIIE